MCSSCWVAVPSSRVKACGMRGRTASSESWRRVGCRADSQSEIGPECPKVSGSEGKLGLLPALGAHQFREAIQQPVADRPGRLGGYVPRRDAGAPSRNHQVRHLALLPQGFLNFRLLVGHHQLADHRKAFARSRSATTRPETSTRCPRKQESLTVMTAARIKRL